MWWHVHGHWQAARNDYKVGLARMVYLITWREDAWRKDMDFQCHKEEKILGRQGWRASMGYNYTKQSTNKMVPWNSNWRYSPLHIYIYIVPSSRNFWCSRLHAQFWMADDTTPLRTLGGVRSGRGQPSREILASARISFEPDQNCSPSRPKSKKTLSLHSWRPLDYKSHIECTSPSRVSNPIYMCTSM